ncbi:protein disulfide-isomerase A6 homolog [Drosophila mojavensis]|uniref:protein disulfide-isomerase n=1 Tax=Drosophila mojavensis TaxID=7230 RepID=B4KIH7_DROMO|nr:protein disulfide-isomerase A6 homolog [Drosophila mojavensis]EDW11320.1 uncharacterized protein Dmoj_GI17079 [Drosophila mojavensis]
MNQLNKSWSIRILVILALCSVLMLFMMVAGQSSGLYSPTDGVAELSGENFDSTVLQDDAIWVVQFYAPWCSYCHALVPEYKQLAKALKGVVKLGVINGERNSELSAAYEVQGFPMIKIFGVDKKNPVNFFGPRTAIAIAESAMAEIKKQIKGVIGGEDPETPPAKDSICMDSDVIELQPNDFKEQVLKSQDIWLVEFYTPWCPHCKSLAPEWIKVAKELKGKFKVGAVDASAHSELAAEYKVQGYPTIFYIPAQTEHAADAIEYKGSKRTADGIIDWVNTQDLALVPAFKIVEITSEDALFNACVNEDWCLLAFLPTLKDCNAKCRNHMLNVLRGVGHNYKKQRWGWVWSEATVQMPLEKGLGISYKYPSLAVVNCMKMKMALFRGPMTTAAVDEFLADIAKGRGKLTYVNCDDLPRIANIAPWDGKDAKKDSPAGAHPIPDEL